MANKLNVLVGAVLAQNVKSDLNKQLRDISATLNAINLKAEIDTKSIKEAFKKIDFTNADKSAKTFAQTINTKVSAAMDKIGDKTQNVVIRLKNANIEAKELASILNNIDDVNIRANVNTSNSSNSSSSGNSDNSNRRQTSSLNERWQNEFEHLQRQMETTVTRLRSQYGDLFDELEFREIYNINSEIEGILNSENASWEQIRNRIRECNDVARDFQTNLAATSRENRNNAAEQNVAEQIRRLQSQADQSIEHLQRQIETSIVRMRSQFGEAFNETAYRNLFSNVNAQAEQLRERINSGEMSAEELRAQMRQVRTEMQNATDEANRFRADLASSTRQARELNNQASILNNTLGRFMQFYGLGEIFRGVKTATVSILTNIKDIDSSMVELKKVTEETDYTYEHFLEGSAKKAKDLGITMTDYIDAVTNFARMDVGGFEAAQEVAEVANIMQQVSESLTADQASEYLISIMKGFNIEADESITIVDKLNNIDRCSYIEIYKQTDSSYRETNLDGKVNSEDKIYLHKTN